MLKCNTTKKIEKTNISGEIRTENSCENFILYLWSRKPQARSLAWRDHSQGSQVMKDKTIAPWVCTVAPDFLLHHQADVFSCGCVLFELLSWRLKFQLQKCLKQIEANSMMQSQRSRFFRCPGDFKYRLLPGGLV